MSRLRRVVKVLVVFLALMLVLIFSLPFITESLIKISLSSQGMLNPDVSVEKLSFKHIKFKTIGFQTCLQQQEVSVSLRNVQLYYSIDGLLSGYIHEVIVPGGNIVVKESLEYEHSASKFKISSELPQVSRIPIKVLTLGHINIVRKHNDKPVIMMDANGSVKVEQNKLLGILDFTTNDLAMTAHLAVEDNQSFILTMSDKLKATPWFKVSAKDIVVEDEYLRMVVHSKLDLEKGNDWLSAWGVSENTRSAQGDLNINISLGLPVADEVMSKHWEKKLKLHATINMDANIPEWEAYADNIVAKLGLKVSLQEGVFKWLVEKETRLSLIPNIEKIAQQYPGLQTMLKTERNASLIVSIADGLSGENYFKDPIGLSVKNAILVQYGNDSKSQNFQLKLSSLQLGMQPALSVKGFFDLRVKSKVMAHMPFSSFSSHVKGMLEWNNNVLAMNINPEATVIANSLQYNGYRGESITSTLLDTATCQYQVRTKGLTCNKFRLQVKPERISTQEIDVSVNEIVLDVKSLNFNDDELSFAMKTDINEMMVDANNYVFKIDRIKSEAVYNKNKASIKGLIKAANDDIEVDFSGQQNNLKQAGTLKYKLSPVNFSETKSLPSRLLLKGSLPLKINAGRMLADGVTSWKTIKSSRLKKDSWHISNKLQMKIDDLNGIYKNTQFKGLSTQFELQGGTVEGWSFKQPAKVTVDVLDPGIAITQIILVSDVNLSADFKPLITVKNLSAHSLGGTISSEIIDIDLARQHNPFVLKGTGLDLAELLALEQDQGVSGTGIIDSNLPFDYGSSGLSMSKGQLAARVPGGVLRYEATGRIKKMAESNANIKLLLDALSDFNYSELTAETQYSPDGKLEFKIALKGRNPGFQRGKPVHLNVNVEENILTLIRSLQLGDELSNEIDRNLNKR